MKVLGQVSEYACDVMSFCQFSTELKCKIVSLKAVLPLHNTNKCKAAGGTNWANKPFLHSLTFLFWVLYQLWQSTMGHVAILQAAYGIL